MAIGIRGGSSESDEGIRTADHSPVFGSSQASRGTSHRPANDPFRNVGGSELPGGVSCAEQSGVYRKGWRMFEGDRRDRILA